MVVLMAYEMQITRQHTVLCSLFVALGGFEIPVDIATLLSCLVQDDTLLYIWLYYNIGLMGLKVFDDIDTKCILCIELIDL